MEKMDPPNIPMKATVSAASTYDNTNDDVVFVGDNYPSPEPERYAHFADDYSNYHPYPDATYVPNNNAASYYSNYHHPAVYSYGFGGYYGHSYPPPPPPPRPYGAYAPHQQPNNDQITLPQPHDTQQSLSLKTPELDDAKQPCQEQDSTKVMMRSGVSDIVAGMTMWNTFRQAYIHVHDHRRNQQMRVSDILFKSSETFNEVDSFETFGDKVFVEDHGLGKSHMMPKRGFFYCNQTDCPYQVNFSWYKKNLHYKCVQCHLEHNHPSTDIDGLDGVKLVSRATDTTEEEREKIASLAVSSIGMAHIEETLRVSFPLRDFNKKLLHNMVNKKRDKVFGKDRHNIQRLMELGRKCSEEGGVFEPEICSDTTRLVGFHYQTKRMQEYALRFGSYFSTVDGTHDTNKHKLICVPTVCRCSLGLSHLIGVGFHQSESSPNIIRSLKLFRVSSIPLEDEVSIGEAEGGNNLSELEEINTTIGVESGQEANLGHPAEADEANVCPVEAANEDVLVRGQVT
jgi:hypothetical protein